MSKQTHLFIMPSGGVPLLKANGGQKPKTTGAPSGRGAKIGEVHKWKDGSYVKTAQGWVPVKKGEGGKMVRDTSRENKKDPGAQSKGGAGASKKEEIKKGEYSLHTPNGHVKVPGKKVDVHPDHHTFAFKHAGQVKIADARSGKVVGMGGSLEEATDHAHAALSSDRFKKRMDEHIDKHGEAPGFQGAGVDQKTKSHEKTIGELTKKLQEMESKMKQMESAYKTGAKMADAGAKGDVKGAAETAASAAGGGADKDIQGTIDKTENAMQSYLSSYKKMSSKEKRAAHNDMLDSLLKVAAAVKKNPTAENKAALGALRDGYQDFYEKDMDLPHKSGFLDDKHDRKMQDTLDVVRKLAGSRKEKDVKSKSAEEEADDAVGELDLEGADAYYNEKQLRRIDPGGYKEAVEAIENADSDIEDCDELASMSGASKKERQKFLNDSNIGLVIEESFDHNDDLAKKFQETYRMHPETPNTVKLEVHGQTYNVPFEHVAQIGKGAASHQREMMSYYEEQYAQDDSGLAKSLLADEIKKALWSFKRNAPKA